MQLLWILLPRGQVYEKEDENIEKYQDLKRKIRKLWGIRQLD